MGDLLKKNAKLLAAGLAVLGPACGGLIIAGKITPSEGETATLAGAVVLMGSLVGAALTLMLGAKKDEPKA